MKRIRQIFERNKNKLAPEPNKSTPAPKNAPHKEFNLQNEVIEQYISLQSSFQTSVTKKYGGKHEHDEMIWNAVSGSIKLLDATSLASAIHLAKPRKILEVGSFLGFSTRWIMEMSAPYGAKITSVDPRLQHRIFDNLGEHVEEFANQEDRLELIDAFFSICDPSTFVNDMVAHQDGMDPEKALEIVNSVDVIVDPISEFDFIFIDGDHSFEATLSNVELAARMLQPGGMIVVHDAISWPDVGPACQKFCEDTQGFEYLGISGGQEREFLANWWKTITGPTGIGSTTWHMQNSLCDGLAYIRRSKT